ncbi:MAG: VCBS repeat-containing protein [Planctomycetota bacterium]|nr:VCBS repeat-containing protein [Planctomycetota bacterium]
MAELRIQFDHQVIDPDPPGAHHDITLIADVNGNGLNDIIIGCKQGEWNLFWYENPTWKLHPIAHAPNLEAGGVVVDINGNGRPDIVAGMQHGGNELYWFENPGDASTLWTKRILEDRFLKYHDQALGDIDGDGRPEILIASQQAGIIAFYDIPEDPTVEPWPRECCHVIADDMPNIEGLVIVDLDGDGQNEVLAGPNIFHRRPGESNWERESFADDFAMTRVAVADLDGDGKLEIVLSEGESHPGRLAVCSSPDWSTRILRDDLFHPHSLEIADFNHSGMPDIFLAEMGLGKNQDPRMFLFLNRGDGKFEEVIIQTGIPTHEAKVGDLTGNGWPDIVGKPYHPESHIDVWFNKPGHSGN